MDMSAFKSLFVKTIDVPPSTLESRGLKFYGLPSLDNPANSLSDIMDAEDDDITSSYGPTSAMRLAALSACVKIISEDLSTTDIYVKKRIKEGGSKARWVIDDDHHLNTFFQDPSKRFSWSTILEVLSGNANYSGNGAAIIFRNRRTGNLESIDPHEDKEWSIYEDPFKDKVWYETYNRRGGRLLLRQEEVLHFRAFSLDGISGISPISMAAHTLITSQSALGYAANGFSNGGFGGGIINVGENKKLSPSGRLSLARQVRKAQAMGLSPVLDDGHSFVPNKINPKDIDFVNIMKYGKSDFAAVYRIPLEWLDGSINSSSTNREQDGIHYTINCLRPQARKIENELELKLLSKKDKQTHKIEFDLKSRHMADTNSMTVFYNTMLANQVFVPNEVRHLLGYGDREGGDKPIDHQKSALNAPGGPSIHTMTKNSTDEE